MVHGETGGGRKRKLSSSRWSAACHSVISLPCDQLLEQRLDTSGFEQICLCIAEEENRPSTLLGSMSGPEN